MKVLLNLHSLNPGGQEVQFVLLAKHLKMMNVDVGIMISQPGGLLESTCAEFGIQVIPVERNHKYDIFGYLWSLICAVRKFKPDLIYGGGLVPTILKPFHGNTPVIWAVRSSGSGIASKKWVSRAHEYLSAKLIFLADSVIANSYAGRLRAESLSLLKSDISVVRNGIDTDKYTLDRHKKAYIKTKYSLPEEAIIIGTVSRIVPVKNHSLLFSAISLVLKNRSNIKLICVGSGAIDYVNQLKTQADDLGLSGCIVWIDHSDEMPDIYSCMDVFVSASTSEGFPNVIAEAMSSGIPVVATDVGDCREIVGGHGWIVPSGNPEALAEGIIQAIDSLPDWPVEESRKKIHDNYSVKAMVNHTLTVFNSVVKP